MQVRTLDKISKEKRMVGFMVSLYCRKHNHIVFADSVHISNSHRGGLCADCLDVLTYAHAKLDLCRYGNLKHSCRHCKTHCYNPIMRAKIRTIMRYSGPRMLFYAPLESLKHLF